MASVMTAWMAVETASVTRAGLETTVNQNWVMDAPQHNSSVRIMTLCCLALNEVDFSTEYYFFFELTKPP